MTTPERIEMRTPDDYSWLNSILLDLKNGRLGWSDGFSLIVGRFDTERQHQAKLEAKVAELHGKYSHLKVSSEDGGCDCGCKQRVAKLEAELSDLRSLDRHKDKDWAKWYGLYNQKCERVVELEQQLAQLQEDAKRNESLVQQLQELDKDWHELRDERDKLQEENTRLKNLTGRTS